MGKMMGGVVWTERFMFLMRVPWHQIILSSTLGYKRLIYYYRKFAFKNNLGDYPLTIQEINLRS
jgi:hypothetical protein